MRILRGNKSFWQTIRVAAGVEYAERIRTAIRTCEGNAEVEVAATFTDAEADNILVLLQRDIKSAKAAQEYGERTLKAVIAQVNS